MSINETDRYHLKHFVKELSQYRGRHTELVSVYVPEGYEMSKIINHLMQEQGTATNIKSAATRKNVIDALEKMIQHLKQFPRTPKNGLAAFSGNVSEKEGGSDVQVWSIEPPVPMKTRIYRCDKEFILEPLEDMGDVKEIYGLVVLDKRDGVVAMLKGKTIIPLSKSHSAVPGKHKTGGQSAQRMERLRDEAAKEFYRKIASLMKDQFLGNQNLQGIIIGGPGRSKVDFIDQGQIPTELKDKIISVKDLSYTGEFGLQELLEKSEDVLAKEGVMEEKKVMQKFFELLAKDPTLVTYGIDYVKKALNMGAVDTILVSEAADEKIIEEMEETCKTYGSDLKIISVETREGVQLKDIGKFAAILRYGIEDSMQ